jgi:hypothetical protein
MVYFVTLRLWGYWEIVNAWLIDAHGVDIVVRVIIDKVEWHGRTVALHSCSFEVGRRHFAGKGNGGFFIDETFEERVTLRRSVECLEKGKCVWR